MTQIKDERDMSHEALKRGAETVREIKNSRQTVIGRGVDRVENAVYAMGAVSQTPEIPQQIDPSAQPETKTPFASDTVVSVESAREALRRIHEGNNA